MTNALKPEYNSLTHFECPTYRHDCSASNADACIQCHIDHGDTRIVCDECTDSCCIRPDLNYERCAKEKAYLLT